MPVKLIVAVTDNEWFDFLRRQPDLTEVNFWSPSAVNFRALEVGELFLFKLKSPRNVIAGGGVFAHGNIMPCSLAWKAFGEANGAGSFEEMRRQIARHRNDPEDRFADFEIGCRILTQPFFLPEEEWLPIPSDFSSNIVRFKTYDTSEREASALWEVLAERVDPAVPTSHYAGSGLIEAAPQARFGEPHLIVPRLGQGAFRILVTDIYQRRCAVTGERTLPVLDAAHIKPYSAGGEHTGRNGILLRTDIHRLFDDGYVTITPKRRFEVSTRIKEQFENGREYYRFHGQPVREPTSRSHMPDDSFLTWHNESRFRG
jgi:putative restriction endonuclease